MTGKTELEHMVELVEFVRYRASCGVSEALGVRLSSSLEINAYNDDFWSSFHSAVGMPGLLIRVRRIESAVIDPWQIIVEDVGEYFGDTCSAFAHAASKLPMFDAKVVKMQQPPRVRAAAAVDGGGGPSEDIAGGANELENEKSLIHTQGCIGDSSEEIEVGAPRGEEEEEGWRDWEQVSSHEEEDTGAYASDQDSFDMLSETDGWCFLQGNALVSPQYLEVRPTLPVFHTRKPLRFLCARHLA